MVTQGTEPKLTTIDRWSLYPGLKNFLFVWPICLCMIDNYRWYESCSSQNVILRKIHKHGRNKLVKNTKSIILDFDNWPFSFHRLNDRQSKIRLHAVNDTTTAKFIKEVIFICLKLSVLTYNWPIDSPPKMASCRTSFVGPSFVFTCQSCLCKSLSPSPSPIIGQ